MTHVLGNLSQGCWGKRALAPRVTGMTTPKNGDGATTTSTHDIARAATTYCSDLFAPAATPDDGIDCGYGCTVTELIAASYDLWEYDINITGDDLRRDDHMPKEQDNGTRQTPDGNVGDGNDNTPSGGSGVRMDYE